MVHDEAKVSIAETEVKFDHVRYTIGRLTHLRQLNEFRAGCSRRGLTGQLFSANHKYFGNQQRPHVVPVTTGAWPGGPSMICHHDAVESKLYKPADYTFILQDYRLAFSVYQMAKCEYNNDKISTLVYYELLMRYQLYAVAAMVLTHTSLENAKVLFPFYLEQAAYCHLKSHPLLPRKFTFHLILAMQQFVRVLAEHYQQAIHYYFQLLTDSSPQSHSETNALDAQLTKAMGTFSPSEQLAPLSSVSMVVPATAHISPQLQGLYPNELLYLYSNSLALIADQQALDIPNLVMPLIPTPLAQAVLPITYAHALECCLDWATVQEVDGRSPNYLRRCSVGEIVVV
ncbi:hypothetical protein H4R35_004563 [Dimargaris xerosporica]|nr:hypothetical protein H4R35_004563 [Dimargaris xerosporica]